MPKRLPNKETPADEARRDEAARKLRKLLDNLLPSPYSEEETYRHIDEARAAIRQQESRSAGAPPKSEFAVHDSKPKSDFKRADAYED